MDTPAFSVTPQAVEFGKRKLLEADTPPYGIRVGVRGGGCNGFSYVFDFVDAAREGKDLVYEFEGLRLVVDTKSIELLRGATLDFEPKLVGYGFKWRNPQAKDVCGCGDSFDLARG